MESRQRIRCLVSDDQVSPPYNKTDMSMHWRNNNSSILAGKYHQIQITCKFVVCSSVCCCGYVVGRNMCCVLADGLLHSCVLLFTPFSLRALYAQCLGNVSYLLAIFQHSTFSGLVWIYCQDIVHALPAESQECFKGFPGCYWLSQSHL